MSTFSITKIFDFQTLGDLSTKKKSYITLKTAEKFGARMPKKGERNSLEI